MMLRHSSIRVALCVFVVSGAVAGPIAVTGVAGATPDRPVKSPTSNPHGVTVVRPDGAMIEKIFRTAQCSIKGDVFNAVSTLGAAKLVVRIKPFRGFRRYVLGSVSADTPYDPTFVEFEDGTDAWASNFIAPYKVASGGAIDFADGGKLLGAGYQPMFNENGSSQVIVTGVTVCHYPRTRKR